jgi:hypothetical protein
MARKMKSDFAAYQWRLKAKRLGGPQALSMTAAALALSTQKRAPHTQSDR